MDPVVTVHALQGSLCVEVRGEFATIQEGVSLEEKKALIIGALEEWQSVQLADFFERGFDHRVIVIEPSHPGG